MTCSVEQLLDLLGGGAGEIELDAGERVGAVRVAQDEAALAVGAGHVERGALELIHRVGRDHHRQLALLVQVVGRPSASATGSKVRS